MELASSPIHSDFRVEGKKNEEHDEYLSARSSREWLSQGPVKATHWPAARSRAAPCLGVPPDRGHVDAAPQRGLLERDAAPRRARELGAAHDLPGAQLEEDDAQDVARQPRPVPRRRRRFHAAAEAAAAGGGGHRLGWERVDLRQ